MTIAELTSFFGWCTVINFMFLIVTAFAVIVMHGPVKKIHGALFSIEEASLDLMYFKFMAYFKLMVIVFNLVPWIALKMMA